MFKKSFLSVSKLLALVVVVTIVNVSAPLFVELTVSGLRHAYASINSPIEVWWPVDGVTVSGTQPFKIMLENVPVTDYRATWRVDGGTENAMETNSTDYPHKEANVDLSGWTWHGSGPYTVTFTTYDNNNQKVGEQSVVIYTGDHSAATADSLGLSVTSASTVDTSNIAPTDSAATETPSKNLPSKKIDSPSSVNTNQAINVWWPTEGATLSGVQPFKGLIDGQSLSAYNLYWQVDDRAVGLMADNNTDSPHKETSVDVSGWNWSATGKYVITFVAKDTSGQTIGQTTRTVYVNGQAGSTASLVPTPVISSNSANPLSGVKLFVDPNSPAKGIDKIASQPVAKWLGGWSNVPSDVTNTINAANSQGAVASFVVYNIPQRDCGGYSAGGAGSADAYKSWVSSIANTIGSNKAAVILEPDALPQITCLNSTDQARRYELINYAVNTFKSKGNIAVYLDAGNASWISASDIAGRLKQAGIGGADGFALNTSGFIATDVSTNYGTQVSGLVSGKHFIVDTSRNGLGPTTDNQWCNPSGRALGNKPTTNTGNTLVDAYLWVKQPGESDGWCNGGPSAGTFWSDYAWGLASRANW